MFVSKTLQEFWIYACWCIERRSFFDISCSFPIIMGTKTPGKREYLRVLLFSVSVFRCDSVGNNRRDQKFSPTISFLRFYIILNYGTLNHDDILVFYISFSPLLVDEYTTIYYCTFQLFSSYCRLRKSCIRHHCGCPSILQ